MAEEPLITMMYDLSQRKIGCVLLQAAYGCPRDLVHRWPVDLWILAPVDTLKPRSATKAQWEWLAKKDAELAGKV